MNPVVFQLSDHDPFQSIICEKLHYEAGKITTHHFPDGEILVTIHSDVRDKNVIFILSTDRPNEKLALLIFAAETARSLGAKKIGLITPYLAYMRQDIQFHPGEGISSIYFAKIISTYFDWLMTVDPHLHRWHSLDAVFSIPSILLHAANNIAAWVEKNVVQPLFIGPDKESEQWVSDIANAIHAPYLVVEKKRLSDTNVESTIPNIENYKNHTPVIVDDIISTAETMIATVNHLKSLRIKNIYCIGVHAIFSGDAYHKLNETGVTEIVTCNTVIHPSNKIDLSNIIVEAIQNRNMS